MRIDQDTGAFLELRRITIALDQQTREGDTEIHILTNLPARIRAKVIARLYQKRWTIETAFQELTVALKCEINTLAYPKAALFGFCVDRKSTRLNSSHLVISYAVFCLKKKKKNKT